VDVSAHNFKTLLLHGLLVPHSRWADWKPASSKGVAFRQHLYTRAIDGGLTDQIEHWLDSEYEAPAADALQKVWDDSRLTPRDWVCRQRFWNVGKAEANKVRGE
jgi:hypothetical protein